MRDRPPEEKDGGGRLKPYGRRSPLKDPVFGVLALYLGVE